MSSTELKQLQDRICACRKCTRLVEWRESVAREKVKRFANQTYWGKAVPSFGDPRARLLIVGLAPAAHGANRTGRMFTGDRSGDWLYRSLHHFGFATQAEAVARDDGLKLRDCYITATIHCAPPQNKPTRDEKENCFPYLIEELQLLKRVRVIVALGKIGFDTTCKAFEQMGLATLKPRPKFGHASEARLTERVLLIGSYHPSQQNTFTGKLTRPMLDKIFRKAQNVIAASQS